MGNRVEKDSLGEISVTDGCYWGAQTERSLENFPIGTETFPGGVIDAYAIIKKASAYVNNQLGVLPIEKRDLIVSVCDEILAGSLRDQFPLVIWQSGSGTQTNMNVNEVISNRGIELAGGIKGSKSPLHPNDDVNKSQSTNDTFPTAMHIATVHQIVERLIPSISYLRLALQEKAEAFKEIIKVGRTHLMDATPLTLGQEFSGYVSQLDHAIEDLNHHLPQLYELAIGGSAVGTGINTPPGFKENVVNKIAALTSLPFVPAPNPFEALASHDPLVAVSGSLRRLACALMKIANDIRLLASGPRCGLSEITLPSNEPGSSIMPGKVNPTQCEVLTMVVAQVIGNDATIAFAGSQGQFELNVYKPVILFNLLQSIRLLGDSCRSFAERCVEGITPNRDVLARYIERSLMHATVLNQTLGYDKASQIVKKAHQENLSLKEAALLLELLTSEEYDTLIHPEEMV